MELANKEPDTHAPMQTMVVKKHRSAWSTVAFIFLLLAIVAGVAAFWAWSQWQEAESRLLNADNDKTAMQLAITKAKTEAETLQTQINEQKAATGNDEEQIKQTAKDHNSYLSVQATNPAVAVTKQDADQAIATVTGSNLTYKAYLKKVNNTWHVVYSGQAAPSAEVVKQYGLKI